MSYRGLLAVTLIGAGVYFAAVAVAIAAVVGGH